MTAAPRQKIVDLALGATFGLAIFLCALVLIVTFLNGVRNTTDEATYWAAGTQILNHQDPYDRGAIFALEKTAGYSLDHAEMMRNLPPALLLTLGLATMNHRMSSVVWSVALLIALCGCIALLFRLDGRGRKAAYLLGLGFGPAAGCINSGQLGILVLAGMVLFLALERSSPFCAGLALWLCFLKPHLFVPFGIVLVLWMARERKYRLCCGLVVALAAGAVLITVLDPHVWLQYRMMMYTEPIYHEPIPCLSMALRDAVWPQSMWIQYAPCTLGGFWAVWYYRVHRKEWKWSTHGGLLMLVSVCVAPYAWFTDQAVLLPALLYVASRTSLPMLALFAVCNATIQIGIMRGMSFYSREVLLTAPMWIAWYLWARVFDENRASTRTQIPVTA